MTRRLILHIDTPPESRTLEVRCEWCRHWHLPADGSWLQKVRAPRGECYGMTGSPSFAVEGEVFDTWTMPDWGCKEFEQKEPA